MFQKNNLPKNERRVLAKIGNVKLFNKLKKSVNGNQLDTATGEVTPTILKTIPSMESVE